jgi:hypothetical protein
MRVYNFLCVLMLVFLFNCCTKEEDEANTKEETEKKVAADKVAADKLAADDQTADN